MKKHRRKTLLVNPDFQIRFGLYLTTLNLLAAAILIVLFTKWVVAQVLEALSNSGVQGHPVLGSIQMGGSILLATLLIMNLVSFFAALKQSHRIIGPILRFEKHVEELKQGKTESRIVLRDGDHFMKLAQLLNELTEQLEKAKK